MLRVPILRNFWWSRNTWHLQSLTTRGGWRNCEEQLAEGMATEMLYLTPPIYLYQKGWGSLAAKGAEWPIKPEGLEGFKVNLEGEPRKLMNITIWDWWRHQVSGWKTSGWARIRWKPPKRILRANCVSWDGIALVVTKQVMWRLPGSGIHWWRWIRLPCTQTGGVVLKPYHCFWCLPTHLLNSILEPNQSLILTVSCMYYLQSSSVMHPNAAFIPSWALTMCDRVRKILIIQTELKPCPGQL